MQQLDPQNNEKLTAAEIGKLWITYIENTMSTCIFGYFLQNVEDQEIKQVVEYANEISMKFTQSIRGIFEQENFPIPIGFTQDNINIGAPRLFLDELYLHYLKYVSKSGMSLYSIAIPLMSRKDVQEFFTNALELNVKLTNQVNRILSTKGKLVKPPYIPIPQQVDFVKKESYLHGFFGDVRPLDALEIAHLYDSLQSNITSKADFIGFIQSAKSKQIREYFVRGKEIAAKHIDAFSELLHKDDLPSPPLLDHLVTDSTFSPFSDKLMLQHTLGSMAMRVRNYGNALAFSARRDVALVYARLLAEIGSYAEDGAKMMLNLGWLERMPQAADRKALALK